MGKRSIFRNRIPIPYKSNANAELGVVYQRGFGKLDEKSFFVGVPFQRGHGFGRSCRYRRYYIQKGKGWGSAFRWLIKSVKPLFIRGAKSVGRVLKDQAVVSAANLMGDIASGENVGQSISNRVVEGLTQGGKSVAAHTKRNLENYKRKLDVQEEEEESLPQSGRGIKRRKIIRRKKTNARRKKKASSKIAVRVKGRRSRCNRRNPSLLNYKTIFDN